eukprot:TRINITY_DN24019_c0_g1_i3.p1 TRINITY_DN24019_c0_g1~~TRINITY_DN24019_c0_g1_i3.p1  ORF type:complete len:614 (-),score=82.68 TRINITY_DN24019_c0_g1_i3:190-1884(-)
MGLEISVERSLDSSKSRGRRAQSQLPRSPACQSPMSQSAALRSISCSAVPRRRCRQLLEWSVEQVASWVAMTALPLEVAELLRENAINGQVLESLTERDMLTMGIHKFGWRRQLLLCRTELIDQLERQELAASCAEMIEIHSPAGTTSSVASLFDESSSKMVPSCSTTCSTSGKGETTGPSSLRLPAGGAHLVPSSLSMPVAGCNVRGMQSSPTGGTCPSASGLLVAANNACSGSMMVEAAADATTSVEPPGPPVAYKVDNSCLRSRLEGLEFHRSQSLADTREKSFVPWGTIIHGIPCGNDWVRVGEYYLPARLNGVNVLQRLGPAPAPTASPQHLPARQPSGLRPQFEPVLGMGSNGGPMTRPLLPLHGPQMVYAARGPFAVGYPGAVYPFPVAGPAGRRPGVGTRAMAKGNACACSPTAATRTAPNGIRPVAPAQQAQLSPRGAGLRPLFSQGGSAGAGMALAQQPRVHTLRHSGSPSPPPPPARVQPGPRRIASVGSPTLRSRSIGCADARGLNAPTTPVLESRGPPPPVPVPVRQGSCESPRMRHRSLDPRATSPVLPC